jgi:hypothetical protein
MTDMNDHASTGRYRPLSEDELNAVAGGAKAAAPPSKVTSGKLFEIGSKSMTSRSISSRS